MATKKTTTGKSVGKSAGKPAARKPATTGRATVIDPPKKPVRKTPAKKPVTVDAKAVVNTTHPASSETPPESKNAPKAAQELPGKPADRSYPPNAVMAGGAALAVVAGFLLAGLFTSNSSPEVDASSGSGSSQEIADLRVELQARLASINTALGVLSRQPHAPPVDLSGEIADLAGAVSENAARTQARLESIGTNIEAFASRLDVLAATVDGIEIKASAANAVISQQDFDELQMALEARQAEVDALEVKVATLTTAGDAKLQAALEQADALQRSADEAASAAVLKIALGNLDTALRIGTPFSEAILTIESVADVTVSSSLADFSETGVVPLTALQHSFPDAARAGLKAAIKAEGGDGLVANVTSFFKSQVGARSLEEKQGETPDALLSQAEAALGDGRVAAAVGLIDRLPEAGQMAMAEWREQARARTAAETALSRLKFSLDDEE